MDAAPDVDEAVRDSPLAEEPFCSIEDKKAGFTQLAPAAPLLTRICPLLPVN
jgi:hypothetical protein